MSSHKLIALGFVLAVLVMASSPAQADFTDDFDDGVVDPRYSALGTALLSESGGKMTVMMLASGDGVSMFIEDVAPSARCFTMSYEPTGYEVGEAVQIEFIFSDPDVGEFTGLRVLVTQTGSVQVKVEAFDKDGKLVGSRTFCIEDCDHAGPFSYQLDLVDGKWVFDWGKGIAATDCPVTRINLPWVHEMLGDIKATKVVVTSQSDGVVDFDGFHVMEEEHVFPLGMAMLATGSARFPGDAGIPAVFTTRPNGGISATDDNMTVTLVLDNNAGGPIGRNLRICADRSAVSPTLGLSEITGFFRPVGGGAPIMNPIVLLSGRTILRLEVSAASVKAKMASIVNKRPINLPLKVLADDPAVDTNPCFLDGITAVSHISQTLGLRRRAGSADDDQADAFFVVRFNAPTPGDALVARFKVIDLPKVGYSISGFEVVAGEFGGSGLPGLDAIELRTEHLIVRGSPDMSQSGLVRAFGTLDGIGEIPTGAAPTTVVLDTSDVFIDPTVQSGLVSNLFVLGYFLPGETSPITAIGADLDPGDSLLADSSFILSRRAPASYILEANFMLRLLINGDRSTVIGGISRRTGTLGPEVELRALLDE